MNEIITKDKEFKDLVYVIHGEQVMLDSDLAELYGYEVKYFNRQVKNNLNRFPEDFRFQLTLQEAQKISRCKNCTLNEQGKNIKYAPYVFTEQGIYMLSAVLKGELAEKQSVYIIREFKKMRHYLAENQQLLNNTDFLKLSTTIMQNKDDIQNIKNTMATKTDIDKIMDNFINNDKIKEKIILNGQVFDAIETYINIYKQATCSIYIIDDYINIDTLNLLKHKQNNVNITIFTGNKGVFKLSKTEINKFNIQYPSLSLKFASNIHDRFIVIDYGLNIEKFYVCGSSSKDAGHKICTVIQLQDHDGMHFIIDQLLKNKNYVF